MKARSLKFVGIPCLIQLPIGKFLSKATAVNPINGNKTVISYVVFLSVLPHDLETRMSFTGETFVTLF
jgi:hypothetical protein